MARVNVTKLITDDTTTPTQPTQTPTPAPTRKTTRPPQKPTKTPPSTTHRKTTPTTSKKTTQPTGTETVRRGGEPPEPEGIPGEKRITLPLWTTLWRALQLARIDDGIDTTIRLRTMIELWIHDDRIRTRVDKLAKQRASTLSRGRPRRDH